MFADVAQDFIDFVGDDGILVAHNASFDMGFINYELRRIGREEYNCDNVVDTLEIARKMFPGSKNNLDALCKRFGVDNSNRTLHGALLDADLLAKVYLELLGGDEPSMLADAQQTKSLNNNNADFLSDKKYHEPRIFAISEAEEKANREFLEAKIKNSIWLSDESESADKGK